MSKINKNITNAMQLVEEKSKVYENLTSRYDPHYKKCLEAIKIIEKYIIDTKSIIYGGTAIDFALRLCGDSIYPDEMLDIPDYDFFSNDSVAAAYKLAEILYRAGYPAVRAIVATHVQTMRVDIIDNHFLADISYVRDAIYKSLPTLKYKDMLIIHPMIQKIDLHSSLCFPFDNPPREVIFARWRKDIARFNKLHHHYPNEFRLKSPQKISFSTAKIPIACRKIPLGGFAGYAIVLQQLINLRNALSITSPLPKNIIKCNITVDSEHISFDTLNDVTFAHYDIDEIAKLLDLHDIEHHDKYFNLQPKHITGKLNSLNIKIMSTAGRLLCIHRAEISSTTVICTSIQYILMEFLAQSHLALTDQLHDIYITMYESILSIISLAEDALLLMEKKNIEDFKNVLKYNPFLPNIVVFGEVNESPAYKIQLNRALADIGEGDSSQLQPLPVNYYPARGNLPPTFDYSTSQYF